MKSQASLEVEELKGTIERFEAADQKDPTGQEVKELRETIKKMEEEAIAKEEDFWSRQEDSDEAV